MKSNKITSEIIFFLGDKEVKINFLKDNISPTTTVLNYLRNNQNRKSVKEGCAEGDCGACTIVLVEAVNENLKYRAVNSCIMFLPTLHGKQILTVEDLGNSTHLHPVQEAMVETDASQCGFCTPGFTMSIFALFKTNNNPELEDIQNALSGNLCRCTGYRPIIDAAEKSCVYKGMDKFTGLEKITYNKLSSIKNGKNNVQIKTGEHKYFLPGDLKDMLNLKTEYPNAIIAGGTTDSGLLVTKKKENLFEIIDISQIDELKNIEITENEYKIGSNVNLENLRIASENDFSALFEMLSVFGSLPIRNRASLGGNLASASPIGDTIPVLMAYDATIIAQSANVIKTVKIRDFIKSYRTTILKNDEIITEIIIPKILDESIIKSYKVSKRRDLDISTVSACFRLKLNSENIVESFNVFYGGMSAITKNAEHTEKQLIGKSWNRENVENAATFLEKDFQPISDARSGTEARILIAGNLLLKFYNDSK